MYSKEVGPSQASSSLTVKEITQQVRNTVTQEIDERLATEIEQRITNKLKTKFEQVRTWMDFIRSQGDTGLIQILDASSGHRRVRESVGDDTEDDELLDSYEHVSLFYLIQYSQTHIRLRLRVSLLKILSDVKRLRVSLMKTRICCIYYIM